MAIVGHDAPADSRAAARVTGFLSVAEASGIEAPIVWRVPGPTTTERGSRVIGDLLAAHPAIDAVFFVSDMMAVGGLLECQRCGWDVPGRVAIAGFGGSEITALTRPAITTVHIPRRTIGEQAAELLLTRLTGGDLAHRVVDVGYEVVAREST